MQTDLTKQDLAGLPDDLLRQIGLENVRKILGPDVADRVFGTFEERQFISKLPKAKITALKKLKFELEYAESRVRNLKRRIAEIESI